jgi:PAS domain S-box-containing protein
MRLKKQSNSIMENELIEKLEERKSFILAITVLICVILNGYATFILVKEIVYTHFFYIPIILAGLWYHKKAVYLAAFFGGLHVLTAFFFIPDLTTIRLLECFQRGVIFILVAYVIGFVSEKRDEAEERIIKERDRSQEILSTIGEAVYILDPNLNIMEVNRTHLKMFDVKVEEVIGMKCYQLFFNVKERCPDCPLTEVFNNGVCIRKERLILSPNDEIRYVDVIFCPLFDEEGNVVEVICDVRDITKRKEMEEKLAYSERLTAIGELSSGVAHEIRQPLGVISNSVYFLGNKLKDIAQDKVKRHLMIMEKEVKHANRLITDLLAFARFEEPLLKDCDINQVVEEVLSFFEIPSNVMVKKELKEGIPIILADSYQIQRICFNLVSNALSAMPEGGSLEIRTGEDKDGENIVISIADSGEGISKENIEKVFEPYFTTRARGFGLGLTLCKKYAVAHRGRIELESEVGKGTNFIVKLPFNRPFSSEKNTCDPEKTFTMEVK